MTCVINVCITVGEPQLVVFRPAERSSQSCLPASWLLALLCVNWHDKQGGGKQLEGMQTKISVSMKNTWLR